MITTMVFWLVSCGNTWPTWQVADGNTLTGWQWGPSLTDPPLVSGTLWMELVCLPCITTSGTILSWSCVPSTRNKPTRGSSHLSRRIRTSNIYSLFQTNWDTPTLVTLYLPRKSMPLLGLSLASTRWPKLECLILFRTGCTVIVHIHI